MSAAPLTVLSDFLDVLDSFNLTHAVNEWLCLF